MTPEERAQELAEVVYTVPAERGRYLIAMSIRAAVAEEREACAKVAEQANDCCECGDPHGPGFSEAAKAIRARA